VLINASIKHICLRISCLPRIGWRDFNLIEVVVSIMVALGTSFVHAIYFSAFHLDFVFTISPQFHVI